MSSLAGARVYPPPSTRQTNESAACLGEARRRVVLAPRRSHSQCGIQAGAPESHPEVCLRAFCRFCQRIVQGFFQEFGPESPRELRRRVADKTDGSGRLEVSSALEAAHGYLARRWIPVPLAPHSK